MSKKEEPLQPGGSVHICSGNKFYVLKEDDPHLSLFMRAHENLEV